MTFRNPIRYGLKKELFIAPEGLYSGQVRKSLILAYDTARFLKVKMVFPGAPQLRRLCCALQAVYAGKKATLSIGNIKPVGEMPEGAIICNVEEVGLQSQEYPVPGY